MRTGRQILVAAYHKLQLIEGRMQQDVDTEKERWKKYDWEFHLALIRACNSSNLLALHATLFGKYLRYQMLVLTNRGEAACDEHKALFEAALARNSATATDVLRAHIINGVEHTLDAM